MGHKFNQITPDIAVHHGSLSKEERRLAEDKFKTNLLRAIVCTSTLELGIDVGQIDLVIQYLSPRQVNSLIQRVGRSGHKLNLLSEGVIITAFPEDSLEAIATVQRAHKGLLEPIFIHENALDVLAHQVAGILLDHGQATTDQILGIIHGAYPYRNLSRAKLLEVVSYLHRLGQLHVEGNALTRRRNTWSYYYKNLSMIPDEKRYPIVDVLSDRTIGTLGDEFMALRARIGLNFICRGKVWRIVQIEDETGTVYVVPSEDPMAAIPGWDGELLPVPFSLAQEVGKLRKEIAAGLDQEGNRDVVAEKLAEKLSTERPVLLESIQEIEEHLKRGAPLPTDKQIFVEAFDKYLIIHACFGEVINRSLGCIFDSVLSDKELITGWWNDGYRILIEMTREAELKDLDSLRSILFSLTPEEVDQAFEDYLKARFPFSYKMKFVAERFGALPRGKSMGPDRLAELPRRFRDTPIFEETIREAMLEKVDLSSVKDVMKKIEDGKITVKSMLCVERSTPLAYTILEKCSEVPELMAPEGALLSNLERMQSAISARKVTLLCLSCGEWWTEKRLRELPQTPICVECGSGLLAQLRVGQDPKELRDVLRRRLEGQELADKDLEHLTYARRTADLVLSYGKKALVALQVRGVGPETASRILGKMHTEEDDFYMDLLKAKIQYLRTRQYWEDNHKEGAASH